MGSGKVKALLKRFIRWVLRTYRKEIKKFVDEKIDEAMKEITIHVNTQVSKRIRNEVFRAVVTNKIDIYTTNGAENVKFLVSEYIEKLGGGE